MLLFHVELQKPGSGLAALPLPELDLALDALAPDLDQLDARQVVPDEEALVEFSDHFRLESDADPDGFSGPENEGLRVRRQRDSETRLEVVADSRNRIGTGGVEDGDDPKRLDVGLGKCRLSALLRIHPREENEEIKSEFEQKCSTRPVTTCS